ncbi:MAG: undecaprenyl-diphosphate phosphatase [Candidatus Omnitrophota bacterium]|nr:undecaprenyl-diphosphate phosphatase [Candidatus Omnitrophota bacterium]
MNLFTAFILGIVEGITEFLPVSSTGHLILTAQFLRLSQSEFLKSFEIAIQLGAILSVMVLYWKKIFVDFKIAKRLLAAFIPTAIIGFIFYKLIKKYLLGNSYVVIWSLFLGGIFLIIFELLHRKEEETIDELSAISYKQSFIIGIFQSLAVIPGVSRAAATIIGGLILGLKRKTIVEFSFLLAVPTMLAATAWDLIKNARGFTSGEFGFMAVGFFTSFLVAIIAVRFLLYFIRQHSFIVFGVYRILIAILFWIFGFNILK